MAALVPHLAIKSTSALALDQEIKHMKCDYCKKEFDENQLKKVIDKFACSSCVHFSSDPSKPIIKIKYEKRTYIIGALIISYINASVTSSMCGLSVYSFPGSIATTIWAWYAYVTDVREASIFYRISVVFLLICTTMIFSLNIIHVVKGHG